MQIELKVVFSEADIESGKAGQFLAALPADAIDNISASLDRETDGAVDASVGKEPAEPKPKKSTRKTKKQKEAEAAATKPAVEAPLENGPVETAPAATPATADPFAAPEVKKEEPKAAASEAADPFAAPAAKSTTEADPFAAGSTGGDLTLSPENLQVPITDLVAGRASDPKVAAWGSKTKAEIGDAIRVAAATRREDVMQVWKLVAAETGAVSIAQLDEEQSRLLAKGLAAFGII